MTRAAHEIPFDTFGREGARPVVFAHANGLPPGCYQRLFEALGDVHILAPHHRALWPGVGPAPKLRRWTQFGEDLARFIGERGLRRPIVMGHSLGAVSAALAASREPDLIGALVMIDPVFLAPWITKAMGILPYALRARTPIAKAASRRRDEWPSRDDMFASLRPKPLFSRVSDDVLRHIVDGSTVETSRGVALAFPKTWEAAIFASAPDPWRLLSALEPPTLAIRGAQSSVVTAIGAIQWRRLQPDARFIDVPNAGHMVPLEAPEAVAEACRAFFAELDDAG